MPRMQDVWFFVRRAALVAVVFSVATATGSAQTHYAVSYTHLTLPTILRV